MQNAFDVLGGSVVVGGREPILREAVAGLLRASGFAVGATCGSLADVSEACREEGHVVLVLMDAELASPLSALADLRPPGGALPQILLLARDPDPHTVQQLLLHGAAGVVARTAGAAELLAACRAVAAGGVYVPPDLAVPIIGRLVRGDQPPAPRLTPRELEVMRCAAGGATVTEIAAHLFMSVSTAKTHLRSAYAKLEVPNRSAAVAELLRQGIL